MFYCFYIFEEVVKLSRSTFNHLRRVNYSDCVLEIIYVRLDINTAEQIFDIIEDVSMINKFVNILSIIRAEDIRRWMQFIYNTIVLKRCVIDKENILFYYSCMHGSLPLVKHLSGRKCYNSFVPSLMIAIGNNHLEVVRHLLENYRCDVSILGPFYDQIIPKNASEEYILKFIKEQEAIKQK